MAGWPFDAAEAERRQTAAAQAAGLDQPELTLDLGNGVKLELVLVPAGRVRPGQRRRRARRIAAGPREDRRGRSTWASSR